MRAKSTVVIVEIIGQIGEACVDTTTGWQGWIIVSARGLLLHRSDQLSNGVFAPVDDFIRFRRPCLAQLEQNLLEARTAVHSFAGRWEIGSNEEGLQLRR